MSARQQILDAIKALVEASLPGVAVIGLDEEAAFPQRIPDGGLLIIREGRPELQATDLSPLIYHYRFAVPIEAASHATATLSAAAALDAMLGIVGAAVEADRTLGGLCDWIEPGAPSVDDIAVVGAKPAKGADFELIVEFGTENPLN